MKIIAYSKVPGTTPFVHLGYLSASFTATKPIQGLLLSGTVLLVAGFGIAGGRLWRRHKSAKPLSAGRLSRLGPVASALLVAGILAAISAYVFGQREKRYYYPERATSDRLSELDVRITEPENFQAAGRPVFTFPTEEGEYDLASAFGSSGRITELYTDGWNMPMKLSVTRQDGVLKYVVMSGGPDRILGTPDDITSASLPK